MKKIFLFTLLFAFIALSANAELDRFESSTKYNVKTNPLAQMMENATKKSMQKNNQQKQNMQQRKQNTQNQKPNYNQQYNKQQNTYKKTTSGWT